MDALMITKLQLEAVMLRWEQDARAGKTRTYAETAALPVDQVAAENADYLWQALSATVIA
jgi:hypothetical protein